MIKLSRDLKYLFDTSSCFIYKDEESGEFIRADKLCFSTFRGEELKGIKNKDWDLIHKDGNIANNHVDNLELVIFVNKTELKTVHELEDIIQTLKCEMVSKNNQIKDLSSYKLIADGKITNMKNQVIYEQKRVKALNKELKEQEKEIRRLLDIINSKTVKGD